MAVERPAIRRLRPMGRGRLRVYLGVAPGVGATYAMLEEGWRRRQRGTDVVVAAVETHGRPRTVAQLHGLEVVGVAAGAEGVARAGMDVEAVLARRPAVALVDDLAAGPSGAGQPSRLAEVQVLLDAGIDVVTTLEVAQLESLADLAERILGHRVVQRVPDAVVRSADQLELVDMAPEALRRRVAHGNVVPLEAVPEALDGDFGDASLSALRELGLLWVADQVDDRLQRLPTEDRLGALWETRERVVVALTGAPGGERLVRRAARLAQRARARLLAVHVGVPGARSAGGPDLASARRLVEDLGGEYHEVVATDVAAALVEFARAQMATQLVLGATRRSRWQELREGSVVGAVLRHADDIDVHVVRNGPAAADGAVDGAGAERPASAVARLRRRSGLSPRRRTAGWLLALVGLPLLTVLLVVLDPSLDLSSEMMLALLLVMAVALVGGLAPGIMTAVAAALTVNWFLTSPRHTLAITESQDVIAVLTFLAVAAAVSLLVSEVARRADDAHRSRAEAEALARVAGAGVSVDDDAATVLLDNLRAAFGLAGAAIAVRGDDGWRTEATSGEVGPPVSNPPSVESGDVRLSWSGPALAVEEQRVLQVVVAQLAAAAERRRLRENAARAAAAAAGDRLRTAILRAVSHDLRTPLASIKLSASSLLEEDVEWTPEERREFLHTIDGEADRLDAVVGDLLDMSRLEAGVVDARRVPVDVGASVQRALASLSEDTGAVVVDAPVDLPPAAADPGLLERVLANLVANALRHGGGARPPEVRVEPRGDAVDVVVADHGPGIPAPARHDAFRPFQRLGDGSGAPGVGLGLAVANGFTAAMGGTLALDDTPGGGLTARVRLPVATVEPVPVAP